MAAGIGDIASESAKGIAKNAGGSLADKSVRTPVGEAPIVPVALMAVGLYLCWFAIHYWASDTKWPSDPIKALLTGKPMPPTTSSANEQIANVAKLESAVGAGLGAGAAEVAKEAGQGAGAIASDALQYQDTGYAWGGPADKPGNWDCSSFASYVLGHDLGYALPGGGHYGDPGYPPHTHGPTTLNYLLYGSPVARSQVNVGDLIVSSEHMGIVINASQYISARTPALGVGIDNLSDPFPGGSPVFRRVI
jgi:cell wall-associated NlpC family hydrolase